MFVAINDIYIYMFGYKTRTTTHYLSLPNYKTNIILSPGNCPDVNTFLITVLSVINNCRYLVTSRHQILHQKRGEQPPPRSTVNSHPWKRGEQPPPRSAANSHPWKRGEQPPPRSAANSHLLEARRTATPRSTANSHPLEARRTATPRSTANSHLLEARRTTIPRSTANSHP